MQKNLFPFLVFIFSVFLISSCSTKKKGLTHRVFHNTTSKYNGYFNAKEILKENLLTYRESREESYDSLLNVFLIPDESAASTLFPGMDKINEKCSKVITDHSIQIGREEYCKWIDDSYLLLGKAHFYKRDYEEALKVFNYIVKQYPKNKRAQADAFIWLIKTNCEMGEISDAQLIVNLLNRVEQTDLKKKQIREIKLVNAYYQIKRNNFTEAASQLEQAIPLLKKRWRKNRLAYLLAQLYSQEGNTAKALQYFDLVAKKSSNYDMTFNAKIAQATAVEGKANATKVKADLLKMLKDDKNIEYFDQIYYALGNVSFKQRKYEEGLDFYKKSTQASVSNPKQKSLAYLKLGNYYFDQKHYEPSQTFYDSAVASLPNNYPDYELLKTRSENLQELVIELKVISLNDSLIALAQLTDDELNRTLKNLIRKLEKEEDEKQRQATLLASQGKKAPGVTGTGSWYFYNSTTKKMGYTEFKNKWGDRPLEDSWRRSLKSNFSGGTGQNTAQNNTQGTKNTSSIPSLKDLKATVPTTRKEILALHGEISQALFNSGFIYKEKFKDNGNGIEAFENLLSRYDTTRNKLTAYYQLYRMYLAKEGNTTANFVSFEAKSSSAYYKDLILYEYPKSEFAKLIRAPKKGDTPGDIDEGEKIYRQAFGLFKNNQTLETVSVIEENFNSYANTELAPQFMFLKAMAYSEMGELENFISTLKFVSAEYKKTDQGKRADELLSLLAKKTGSSANSKPKTTPPTSQQGYQLNENEEHFYIVLLSPDLKVNTVTIEYGDFNSKYYSKEKLSVNGTFLDNEHPLILVKSFSNKEESEKYYTTIRANLKDLPKTKIKKLQHFPISKTNFVELFKTRKVDEYAEFCKENYKL